MKSLKEYEPFPIHVLPKEAREFVDNFAHGSGAKQAYVAAGVLACSAIFFEKSKIEIKPNYFDHPNLFIGLVGQPGTTKSGAIQAALAPINKMERQMNMEYMAMKEKYDAEMEEWEVERKGRKPKQPKRKPSCLLSEATMEATIMGLQERFDQGDMPHVAFLKDELNGMFKGMDKYKSKGGDDREMWLQLFTGTNINKRLVSKQIYVEGARVSVFGGLQPDVFLEAMRDKGDGMPDRFIIFFTTDFPSMTSVYDICDSKYFENYINLFNEMNCKEARERFYSFRHSEKVLEAVEDFHQFTHKIGSEYEFGAFKKWEQNFYKMCIILGCLHNKTVMDVETVERAKELCGYLIYNWMRSRTESTKDQRELIGNRIMDVMKSFPRITRGRLKSKVRKIRDANEPEIVLEDTLSYLKELKLVNYDKRAIWVAEATE